MEMTRNLIILSLIVGFLIFGCAGPAEEGGPPAGPPVTPPGDGAQPPAEEPPPAEDGIDFAGLDYASLTALGVPVECDITTQVEGETTQVKLYAKGEDEIRQEFEAGELDCSKFVVIHKPNAMYMGCPGEYYPPESTCNWLVMEFEESEEPVEPTGDMTGATYAAPELGDVPSTQISCRPWIYDASKFQAPGKTCTMEEFMQEIMGDYDYDFE